MHSGCAAVFTQPLCTRPWSWYGSRQHSPPRPPRPSDADIDAPVPGVRAWLPIKCHEIQNSRQAPESPDKEPGDPMVPGGMRADETDQSPEACARYPWISIGLLLCQGGAGLGGAGRTLEVMTIGYRD
jgi:hypothetical protein